MNIHSQWKAEEFDTSGTNQVLQQKCSSVGSTQIRSISVQDGEVECIVKGSVGHSSRLSSSGVTIHNQQEIPIGQLTYATILCESPEIVDTLRGSKQGSNK